LDRHDPTTDHGDDRSQPALAGGRPLPAKISSLRRKLYRKAEREPGFRFYALYDRIYRRDILRAGWDLVRSRDGAAGTAGVTIRQIEASPRGPDGLVDDLHEELRTKRYRSLAVRRVSIDKPDGGRRPLGIPAIRDRVVQAAALLVLEPIFEADFEDTSYGFRPLRGLRHRHRRKTATPRAARIGGRPLLYCRSWFERDVPAGSAGPVAAEGRATQRPSSAATRTRSRPRARRARGPFPKR